MKNAGHGYYDDSEEPDDPYYGVNSRISSEDRCFTPNVINAPSHYTAGGIQPIDYINANKLDFNEGNVIKYITRAKLKNGAEDIKKAIQYCKFILKYQYGEE